MRTVSIGELSRSASRVVADVECSGHATLVTRHGVLVAAIVPVAEEKLDEAARAKLLDALRLATGDADPDLT